MKQKIVPKICISEPGVLAKYEGHVIMRVPDFFERADLSAICQTGVEELDSENPDEIKKAVEKKTGKSSVFGIVMKLAVHLPCYLEEVEIKRLEDGYVFKSFDELKYDSDMIGTVTELSLRLIGKFTVGKDELKP